MLIIVAEPEGARYRGPGFTLYAATVVLLCPVNCGNLNNSNNMAFLTDVEGMNGHTHFT